MDKKLDIISYAVSLIIKAAIVADLRRTCLTRWLFNGLSEYDVMTLAGHAEFETTRQFYLAVREDLLQRAQDVSADVMNSNSVAHLLRAHSGT